jgi:hypothetical protein
VWDSGDYTIAKVAILSPLGEKMESSRLKEKRKRETRLRKTEKIPAWV